MVQPVSAQTKIEPGDCGLAKIYDAVMIRDRWSAEDDAELRRLVNIGTKTPAVAQKLGSTQGGVSSRMATLGIYRREGNRKIQKVAAEHIRVVERRLLKAANGAALALAAANCAPKRGRGRPPASAKEDVTLPIDKAALDHFRADGPGWEKRINQVLRKAAGL
ncbi:BrnA antitoxin family protein [Sphingomonas sp. UYP23]